MLDVIEGPARTPDYGKVIRSRIERLGRIRANPSRLPALRNYYRMNIAQFISDFGVTVDPRIRPAFMPFVLFPRQVELVNWIIERQARNEPGIVVKSRDVGASWLAMAVSASLCLFNRNFMVGIVSAKEANLDRSGDPDTLFYKARQFLTNLPAEFRGGFDPQKHSADLRIIIPESESSITGSTGDNAGRGGRKSVVFVDESAHIDRPQMIDQALATVTNCRIDMSSVNGSANSFAERARNGKIPRFDFGWRDDPRKDQKWYEKKCLELDPVTLAQEVDCSFTASAEGLLIPSIWIHAAVDAHKKLGLTPTGSRSAALDVADQGADKNAFCGRHGILLEHISSWSGKGSDIFATTVKAFSICDDLKYESFFFDSDGLGAGVLGDGRRLNDERAIVGGQRIIVTPFRGSAAVWRPLGEMVPGRKNQDYFANLKAQSWMALRMRFEATWRALQGATYQADDLISISAECGELSALLLELAQPTISRTNAGKILIDKTPDGARSPNLGDAVMIAFSPATRSLENWIRLGQ